MGEEMDRVLDTMERDWYLHQTGKCEGGWDCPICRNASRWAAFDAKRVQRLRARLKLKYPKLKGDPNES